MATRKQTTKKTGDYSKRTVTLSEDGKTETNSSKPPGAINRRTVSHKNGKIRTTYAHTTGGGLRRTVTKTQTLNRKPRTRTSRSRRSRKSSGSFFWKLLFVGLIVWMIFL